MDRKKISVRFYKIENSRYLSRCFTCEADYTGNVGDVVFSLKVKGQSWVIYLSYTSQILWCQKRDVSHKIYVHVTSETDSKHRPGAMQVSVLSCIVVSCSVLVTKYLIVGISSRFL